MATKKKVTEKITFVPLTELHERPDNPIKMRNDNTMQEIIESVKRNTSAPVQMAAMNLSRGAAGSLPAKLLD